MNCRVIGTFVLFFCFQAVVCLNEGEPAAVYKSGIPVRVSLEAGWTDTPLSLEACEFVAAHDGNDAFWAFATSLDFETNSSSSPATAESHYSDAVSRYSSGDAKRSLLELSLATRTHSPAVALHSQFAPKAAPSARAYVVFNGVVYTDVARLSEAISNPPPPPISDVIDVVRFIPGVDHICGSGSAPLTAFLYAHVGTREFKEMHRVLVDACRDGKIKYVLRHAWTEGDGVVGSRPGSPRARLQGYGIEFALKSVEYKAVDEPIGGQQQPMKKKEPAANGGNESSQPRDLDGQEPDLEMNDGFDKIGSTRLGQIGFQAASYVQASKDPLRALRHVSHNFPALAVSLSQQPTSQESIEAASSASRIMSPGESRVLINGRVVEKPRDDFFSILDLVGNEISKAELLRKAGVPAKSAASLLSKVADGDEDPSSTAVRFDVRSPFVTFINDLETDKAYFRFGRSILDFLRPVFPGNLRYVAKNLFTIMAVVDPAHPPSLELCAAFHYFINQMLPMRVGVLLLTPDEPAPPGADTELRCGPSGDCSMVDGLAPTPPSASLAFAKAFRQLATSDSPRVAMSLFAELSEVIGDSGAPPTVEQVRAAYESVLRSHGGSLPWEAVIGGHEADEFIRGSNAHAKRMGIDAGPLVFVNGVPLEDVSHAGRVIGMANAVHTPLIMKAIHGGVLSDDMDDLYGAILDQPGTLPRYSKHVIPTPQAPLRFVSLLSPSESAAVGSAAYFSAPGHENDLKLTTHIVCADVETSFGRQLALEALLSLTAEKQRPSRVAIFGIGMEPSATWKALQASAASIGGKDSVRAALALAKEVLAGVAGASTPVTTEDVVNAGDLAGVSKATLRALLSDEKALAAAHAAQWDFCLRALAGEQEAAAVVVANGRIVALPESANFTSYDFELLENFEKYRTDVVQADVDGIAFEGVDPDAVTSDFRSDALMKAVSLIGFDEAAGVKKFPVPDIQPSFEAGAPADTALVTIDAILNPVSKEAQRFTPIFEAISSRLPVHVRVFLNPPQVSDALPLKTFYHYVIDPTVKFDTSGALAAPAQGVASLLPASRLITLGMDVPHPWIVMASEAKHDLDNIRLGEAEAAGDWSVDAVFRLEHILVEGNCIDAANRVPPRGLELELSPTALSSGSIREQVSDTIVMSNYGYFQLKAGPGIWLLSIREGRSSRLYTIGNDLAAVIVNSFLGNTMKLEVHKRPGMEKELLLAASEDEVEEEQESGKSLWEKLWGRSSEAHKNATAATTVDTINVFSIASGHLYERFIKIMMASVTKHASLPVKFWFIKNYLSPKFKEAIGGLAKKYGFEYELVTYKWPAWLHPQTEKQRLIWGYKVLFLDVLFPVSLKKVIYVDADQVVRGDLAELARMPLNGASIAMTPFCQGDDARQETAGYRFWQQGFWREHLRGKPYHISALFVVDLARFRRIAAGDQYRAHYDSLARDPNSLSNLDQDLPNYLQHVVKMHSLPPEWLWCETWCSDESKARAKTIDLCNNPMTKTPKLESAQRIIPEWTNLDSEVRETEAALNNQTH